jgi:pimeloyl-ACP methyl ester carboxylesterase
MTPPHTRDIAPVTVRRGSFWITGEPAFTPFGHALRGPMFVRWEAPPEPTSRPPVVFVHGGGGQSLDWEVTADGRPGWVDLFVRAGYPCYLVDRPGHGRSPRHPALLGEPGPPGVLEATAAVFASGSVATGHTRWPWSRELDGPELRQVAAAAEPLPTDLAAAQILERDRLAELLDHTGPAVVVAHSLGAAAVWLAVAERPGGVRSIVAIEPAGPPFGTIPGVGTLSWGITAAAITTSPALPDPSALRDPHAGVSIPALRGLPIAVVRAEASPFGPSTGPVAEFLRGLGADAEVLVLAEHGVHGSGHGMMIEAESDDAARPILEWIERKGKG